MGQINTWLPEKEHEKLNRYTSMWKLTQAEALARIIREFKKEETEK